MIQTSVRQASKARHLVVKRGKNSSLSTLDKLAQNAPVSTLHPQLIIYLTLPLTYKRSGLWMAYRQASIVQTSVRQASKQA
jgi:hypothetical protein